MSKKHMLKKINILLADPDACTAQAVIHNLRAMGMPNVIHVRSAAQALQSLRTHPVHFLITEWCLPQVSGIELVRELRTNPHSPNRTLPIIMLTGRGEVPDVIRARDVGITEFLVKPFTSRMLYDRIEQMVDNPRGFVVSPNYVGHERRRRSLPLGIYGDHDRRRTPRSATDSATAERRVMTPIVMPAKEALTHPNPNIAKLIPPDFGLKRALGAHEPLANFITEDVLRQAQRAIDRLADESVQWIREDLEHMDTALARLREGYLASALETLKDNALLIKSRAGVFGYPLASDAARLLYLFLCGRFVPTNPRHLLIIGAHIKALKVMFAQQVKHREGIGAEVLLELERLNAIM